jgi:hypothetical protein
MTRELALKIVLVIGWIAFLRCRLSACAGLIAFTAWSSFAHATVMGFQVPKFHRSPRTARSGYVHCDRRSTDRSSSGKTYETANRVGIGGCVGCSVALPASYPAPAPYLDPCPFRNGVVGSRSRVLGVSSAIRKLRCVSG